MRHTLRFLGLVSLVAVFCWGTTAFAGAVTSKEEIKISTTGGGIKIKSSNGNSFAIGGRIMYDYDSYDGLWNYDNDGDSASESEFRRTRVTLKGTSGKSWAYKMTVDIEGNDDGGAEIDTAYLAYKGLGLGKVMIGRFKAPFGLEELTSSKWISTIERSSAPGFLAGKPPFQLALHGHGGPLFYQLAIIDDDDEDEDGSDAYSLATRIGAHMPIGEGSFMHLAGSFASRDFGDDAEKRFRTRLGVHTVGRPIQSDHYSVDDADQFGLEGAVVMGPLSLQGEYRQADFDAGDGSDPSDVDVESSYIQASYILTGESRGYKGKSGKFDKVKPKGPMGAWELVAKYEDGELDIDAEADEIEYELLTLGVNWYATKNVKLMLNYLDADTDNVARVGDEEDGDAVSFRAQYVF